jgi:hypothetical protein
MRIATRPRDGLMILENTVRFTEMEAAVHQRTGG